MGEGGVGKSLETGPQDHCRPYKETNTKAVTEIPRPTPAESVASCRASAHCIESEREDRV